MIVTEYDPTLRFYFSFNDPYSFLIAPVVLNLSKNYKITIEYIPLRGYDRAGLFSDDKAVAAYYRKDAERFAKNAGRSLNWLNDPQDSTKARRGHCYAFLKMLALKYTNLLFAMRWLNSKDISSTEDIISGLKFLEFDMAELTEALESDRFSSALEEAENLARDDGVIGTPFFVFRGAGYLGADRLGYLEEHIKADPALIIHHDAGYTVIKPEDLARMLEEKKPALVLDIRIPKDFGKAHIPESNCLPSKVAHRNLDRLDRDWSIVLVDDGGVEASEIGFMLASEGFRKISVLTGGFPAWKGDTQAGLDNWQNRLKPR